MAVQRLNDMDNVAVVLDDSVSGVPLGHKVALCDMKMGDKVIKYGEIIGSLTEDVKKGDHIHTHNLKSDLDSSVEYHFSADNAYSPRKTDLTINAFKRENGKIGIRNEIWIIPTVGCVNRTCQTLEQIASKMEFDNVDGVYAFTHPYGCSQLGDDLVNTRRILSNLAEHPNAGGVLIVSLGCEDSNIDAIKPYLSDANSDRIRFMTCQKVDDEIECGVALIKELALNMQGDTRTAVNIDKLVVGLKCGGSDSFSGLVANPLCGTVCDRLTDAGATAVMTETPEMFGAEHILMKRAVNRQVFDKTVSMINRYKAYFAHHNQPCYENPSFGNREGGITTLEEKSLGCIKKGGSSVVTDVLDYGDRVQCNGLNLLYGPGNDIVSITNLTACGAHIILFTTGRGTPLGAPVPTVKIATNANIATKKANWVDIDASVASSDDLLDLIIATANGTKTKNESNNYREIAIFKNGVTM